eukprot:264622-Rhodomonas_salina.6
MTMRLSSWMLFSALSAVNPSAAVERALSPGGGTVEGPGLGVVRGSCCGITVGKGEGAAYGSSCDICCDIPDHVIGPGGFG